MFCHIFVFPVSFQSILFLIILCSSSPPNVLLRLAAKRFEGLFLSIKGSFENNKVNSMWQDKWFFPLITTWNCIIWERLFKCFLLFDFFCTKIPNVVKKYFRPFPSTTLVLLHKHTWFTSFFIQPACNMNCICLCPVPVYVRKEVLKMTNVTK